jgi:DNA replication factor GINS
MKGLFNKLYETWRNERETSELQHLDADYYLEMANYTSKLLEQTRMLDKTGVRGKIMAQEMDYVEKMLRELLRLRLNKIIQAEIEGKPVVAVNLLPEEREFHSDIRKLIVSYSEMARNITMGRMNGTDTLIQEPLSAKEKTGYIVLRFIKPIPAIMGVDMNTYGPFNPEDIATLPEENAENLIRRGFAKVVEIQP